MLSPFPLVAAVRPIALDTGGAAIDRGQVPRGEVRENQEPAGGGEVAEGEPSHPLHVRVIPPPPVHPFHASDESLIPLYLGPQSRSFFLPPSLVLLIYS